MQIITQSMFQFKVSAYRRTNYTVNTVQCYNQGTKTKVKNSEARLCCYSNSNYCLKATAL